MERGLDGFVCDARGCGVLCGFEGPLGGSREFPVVMARGKHLFPFRTEQLSPSAPMVLGSQGPGRVGRRRFILTSRPSGRLVVVSRRVGPSCRPETGGVAGSCSPRPARAGRPRFPARLFGRACVRGAGRLDECLWTGLDASAGLAMDAWRLPDQGDRSRCHGAAAAGRPVGHAVAPPPGVRHRSSTVCGPRGDGGSVGTGSSSASFWPNSGHASLRHSHSSSGG